MIPELDSIFYLTEQKPELLNNAANVLFLRARYSSKLDRIGKENLTCFQTFKPYADEFEGKGFDVISKLSETTAFDACIFLPNQFKQENLLNFVKAYQNLKEGGLLLSSMQNELGASRFETHQGELFGNIETCSKNKCRIFYSYKNAQVNKILLSDWKEKGELQLVSETGFFSRPGIFGWDKIDAGSALLSEFIPENLEGMGADFGCGYGYLSKLIASKCRAVTELYLYDAEMLALEACQRNLSSYQHLKTHFHWWDLTREIENQNFDWVVMNPPFHLGKNTDSKIGSKCIITASRTLKNSGVLYMVSNVKLPYEQVLKDDFSSYETLTIKFGYKVLKAIK